MCQRREFIKTLEDQYIQWIFAVVSSCWLCCMDDLYYELCAFWGFMDGCVVLPWQWHLLCCVPSSSITRMLANNCCDCDCGCPSSRCSTIRKWLSLSLFNKFFVALGVVIVVVSGSVSKFAVYLLVVSVALCAFVVLPPTAGPCWPKLSLLLLLLLVFDNRNLRKKKDTNDRCCC